MSKTVNIIVLVVVLLGVAITLYFLLRPASEAPVGGPGEIGSSEPDEAAFRVDPPFGLPHGQPGPVFS